MRAFFLSSDEIEFIKSLRQLEAGQHDHIVALVFSLVSEPSGMAVGEPFQLIVGSVTGT